MISSLPAVLRERASLAPGDPAITFVDYEKDWAGVPETLTWSELQQRVDGVVRAVAPHSSPGDRAVILAPQGIDYIAAFIGAMAAGAIAVPLPVPQQGAHDDRVTAVLSDTSPTVVLTTSSTAQIAAEYARAGRDRAVPAVVEVDTLALDSVGAPAVAGATLPDIAYLQYTSGSTRSPAGVAITHRNLIVNFGQTMADYYPDYGGFGPPDTTVVSWLPFYHDMGLVLGVCAPILGGFRAVLTSPVAFLQRPARWVEMMAGNSHALSGAPNFAFELTMKRTSEDDLAGLDLGDVLVVISGSERVHAATLDRFARRFAAYNFPARALRPSYGLAEATVYAAARAPAATPKVAHFNSAKLAEGHAERCGGQDGTPLVSYGVPRSPSVRIVDPQTCAERPEGVVGEIWLHGDNVAAGYWKKPEETQLTFGGQLVEPSPGTPAEPWLRTGDLGFVSDGELFVLGRIKDLLILYGRNHYPDDIEATISRVSRGRAAAIAVADDHTEKLVAIVEVRKPDGDDEALARLRQINGDITSAISKAHGVAVADVVLVEAGAIPITTSGKVRRAACVERYRRNEFVRVGA